MSALAEGLAWLDARIAAETRRLRARYDLSLDELRGLYISDAMIDAMIEHPPAAGASPLPVQPLGDLVDRMRLGPRDAAALLVVLAPEIDPRYATFYAYLNDDVARRWATPDLAGRLLAAPALPLFVPDSPLVRTGLVVPVDVADAARPLLHRGWRAAAPLVHRALTLPGQHIAALQRVSAQSAAEPLALAAPWPVLLASGAPGSGRSALAAGHAAANGLGALALHADAIGTDALRAAVDEAIVAARIDGAMLIITGEAEPFPIPDVDVPVAIVTNMPGKWQSMLAARLCLALAVPQPSAATRRALWHAALRGAGIAASRTAIRGAADRFRLSAPAIVRAAQRAALAPAGVPAASRVMAAAREEAAADPGPLARKVPPSCGWDDLVLPAGAMRQLRDFAGAIARRTTVFDDWGFAAVGRATGPGIAALFAGASGTGKTMSASVVAAALGLDLWRIDLSSMVSKYIGETEKNLEKLFSASGAGDAILFFDEADAVFGKRSEVKDAHDRYANIEISYLLQRLEEHEGVVILATNLSRNLDNAFLRRIPFVIDFPLPDRTARTHLWRKAIPPLAPLDAAVDLAALGARFELSGGDIRAAALEAGFLAANNSGTIDAAALATAISRQLLKRGQLPGTIRANGAG